MKNTNRYPRRDRETNILLIRTLMAARNQQERLAALDGLRQNLHPSVISELDQLEATKGSEEAATFVDEIFLAVLPELMAIHDWPEGLDTETLLTEVDENIDFVRYCLDPDADVREQLKPAQVERLEDALRRVENTDDEKLPPRRPEERTQTLKALIDTYDVHVIALETARLIDTALRRLLAYPPSRLRTLSWLRSQQDRRVGWLEPQEDVTAYLESLNDTLDVLAREAEEHRLGRLLDTVHGLQESTREWRKIPTQLTVTATQVGLGSGACGRCAMHFMSIGHPVIDARTPGVKIRSDGLLIVDRPLNLATCPFCGWSARLLTPMVAALPQRGSVIVCIPTPTGEYDAEAAANFAPDIRKLMVQAREGIDAAERAVLDTATVIETFNPLQFFYALHTGSTAPEHHVFNIVRLADGSRMICDQTKHYIGPLASDDPVVYDSEGLPELPDEPVLSAALTAFNRGDTEIAEEGLRQLLRDEPGNVKAKYYLAVVLRATGREVEARGLLYDLDAANE